MATHTDTSTQTSTLVDWGSLTHPIDVDNLAEQFSPPSSPESPFLDTPHPVVGILPRSRRSPNRIVCAICGSRDHSRGACLDGATGPEIPRTTVIYSPPEDRYQQTTAGRFVTTCGNCSRTGHSRSECIFTGPFRCSECGERGHRAFDCRAAHTTRHAS